MPQQRRHAYRKEPFPFSGRTEEEFLLALEGASSRTARSILDLRAATQVCVKELKQGGMTPEGVIVTMRAYLRHAAQDRLPIQTPGEPSLIHEILCDHLAKWCIEEYYP
jgi:hypothetical protein